MTHWNGGKELQVPWSQDRQASGVEGACGRHCLSLSKPKHRQEQPLAASPHVDPAVVERAWEQKVPPCLLKGLAGLSMQSEALWRNLDTAVGEGARQVLGMHKFANGDLACSELGWRPA